MKKYLFTLVVLVCLAYGQPLSAGIVTQWDFNSYSSDDPSIGNGSFELVGNAIQTSAVSLTWYNMKVMDLGDGIGFSVSTLGYEDISLSLKIIRGDGYSYARDWSWSYFDGSNWIDGPDFHVDSYSTGDIETFDLTGLSGVDNNNDFEFRILTSTSFTTTSGVTVGLDDVTVSGTSIVPEPATLTMTLLGLGSLIKLRKNYNK